MLDDSAYRSPTPATGKTRSAERVLRSAMVHGVLRPGQRLSEASLCTDFALGRGAVRAALARLQASGFVSASPRSGWCVAPVSATEIREVVTGRRQLEPLLACGTPGEGEKMQLRRLADMYLALTARHDEAMDLQPTLRRYERDMLDLLAVRLDLPLIAGWLTDLWDRSLRLVLFFEGNGAGRLTPPDRAELAEVLIEGDLERAKALLFAAVDDLENYLNACFLSSAATLSEPAAANPRAADKKRSAPPYQSYNTGRTRTL